MMKVKNFDRLLLDSLCSVKNVGLQRYIRSTFWTIGSTWILQFDGQIVLILRNRNGQAMYLNSIPVLVQTYFWI